MFREGHKKEAVITFIQMLYITSTKAPVIKEYMYNVGAENKNE